MPKNSFANSRDLVEVEDIRDDTLVLEDGSFRKVIMVSGVNLALKSEEEEKAVLESYQDFLNSIDFPVQIVIRSRKIFIESYLEELEERRRAEESPLLQNQISEYATFIKKFIRENDIMEKTFLVVVPWYPAVSTRQTTGVLDSLPFFGKNKGEEEKNERKREAQENFERNLTQLNQRVDQVTHSLYTVDLDTVVLNDEQLTELLYNAYNPEAIERREISTPQTEKTEEE